MSYIESLEILPEQIVRVRNLQAGDLFLVLVENNKKYELDVGGTIYQIIDTEASYGLEEDDYDHDKISVVYNLSGAYVTELDLNLSVYPLGKCKIVQTQRSTAQGSA